MCCFAFPMDLVKKKKEENQRDELSVGEDFLDIQIIICKGYKALYWCYKRCRKPAKFNLKNVSTLSTMYVSMKQYDGKLSSYFMKCLNLKTSCKGIPKNIKCSLNTQQYLLVQVIENTVYMQMFFHHFVSHQSNHKCAFLFFSGGQRKRQKASFLAMSNFLKCQFFQLSCSIMGRLIHIHWCFWKDVIKSSRRTHNGSYKILSELKRPDFKTTLSI